MSNKRFTLLQPDFYDDFGCVAGACRHSCCVHPWIITMDKTNYKKLRMLKKPLWLAQNLGQYIARNPNSKDNSDYAVLKYVPDGGCALQNEEGLCRLQCDLGASYLCSTCRQYPRSDLLYRESPGSPTTLEKSLCSSCEEVVRLLLVKPEPIRFITCEQDTPSYFMDVLEMPFAQQRPMIAHYHAIRGICIAVLQAREYSFARRLKLLCVLMDKLDAAEREERQNGVPRLLDQFVQAVESNAFDSLLQAGTKTDMAKFFAAYSSLGAFGWGRIPYMAEICNRGLQQSDECRAKLFEDYIQDKEYLLEHIFVSHLFGKGIPFHVGGSIWDCAQYMVECYVVLRYIMSAWLAGKGDTPTEVELIDFMALYGKTVLHSNGNVNVNLKLLERGGVQSLAHMITLING